MQATPQGATDMTPAQRLAALATFIIATAGVYLGTRSITNPASTRACIAFKGAKPADLKVTRAVIAMSPESQSVLGMAPVTGWTYAGVEVQSVDGTDMPDYADKIMGHIEVMPEAAWDRTAQGAVAPNCQVFIVRQDDPAVQTAAAFQCGCAATVGTCSWSGGPTVKGITFDPGTFSGAGCRVKPCLGLLGQSTTFPADCQ